MRTHVYLIGLGGGVCVTATLYYPLYLYLPSAYVAGWETAQASLAQILGGGALLLVFIVGAFAARFSGTSTRAQAAAAGAVAGLIASLLAECWLGGPAAGVWGARELLAYGFKPAHNAAHLADLLGNSILGILWWTYFSVWAAPLGGLALGALGGFLAGPGGAPYTHPSGTWPAELSVFGLLTSCMGLIIAIVVYALLIPAAQALADKNSVVLDYDSNAVIVWPIGTNFILFLLWQLLGAWWINAAKPITNGGRFRLLFITYFNSLLPFVWVFLIFNSALTLTSPVVVLGLTSLVGLALLTFAMGWPLHAKLRPPQPPPSARAHFYFTEVLLCLSVVLGIPYFSTVIAGFNLLLVVIGIPTWASYDPTLAAEGAGPTTTSLLETVRAAYTIQQLMPLNGLGALGVLSLLVAGVMYVFMWLGMKMNKRVVVAGPTE